ncbi:hypothetical protein BKA66DRAFT_254880 [Pyrenochaeta sp. MPI-SDFR-AT-0127]|nr:hypothetical protein BKA66DRAFT_254880 [Pyrenochaeta sp. MPI-SDFR-AT-0127]
MDDHHHQPIWPMLQGALDYILNLAGEGWAMIWKPSQEPGKGALPEMRGREEALVIAAQTQFHAVNGQNSDQGIQESGKGD